MQLQDKVALVTGASRGIGKAIALRLAQEGASIAVVYAGNHQAAQETANEIEGLGRKVKTYACDVSDYNATGELVKTVLADFGQVDILVNNAGITRDGLILSMKEEDFDKVVDTNLKGCFLRGGASRECRPGKLRRRKGRAHWPDQKHRQGVGRPGCNLQCHRTGVYRIGYDRGTA